MICCFFAVDNVRPSRGDDDEFQVTRFSRIENRLVDDDFVGDSDGMAGQSWDRFARARDLMNRAIPGVGEAFERDIAVGGGVEKDDAGLLPVHAGVFSRASIFFASSQSRSISSRED